MDFVWDDEISMYYFCFVKTLTEETAECVPVGGSYYCTRFFMDHLNC